MSANVEFAEWISEILYEAASEAEVLAKVKEFRAAVLREAAEIVYGMDTDPSTEAAAAALRRMADEAQQPVQGKPPAAKAWPAISAYLDECHGQIIERTKDRDRPAAEVEKTRRWAVHLEAERDALLADAAQDTAIVTALATAGNPEPAWSPALVQMLADGSAALVRVLGECDRIEREVYGQHDEDDDGMREAVRRIRAAATQPLTRAAIDGAGVTS